MSDCFVAFSSALEVRDFVSIASRQYFPIAVESDNMQADAKSIMSICALGFDRPLHVRIPETADGTEFFSAVRSYMK